MPLACAQASVNNTSGLLMRMRQPSEAR